MPSDVVLRLQELVDRGAIQETASGYSLTRLGWEWYSAMMYYLLPQAEQRCVDTIVRNALRDDKRQIEEPRIEGLKLVGNHS